MREECERRAFTATRLNTSRCTGATANVTWAVQSGGPGGAGPVETYQDGAANGAVQVVREHNYSSRLIGRAVLRREGLVATVLFQALVTGFNGCGLPAPSRLAPRVA